MHTKRVLWVAVMALAITTVAPTALAAKPVKPPVKPPATADLQLTITDSVDPVVLDLAETVLDVVLDLADPRREDTDVTYDLAVTNRGPSGTSVVLDLSIYGADLRQITHSGSCSSPNASDFQCEYGLLRSGATTHVVLELQARPESLVTGVSVSGNAMGALPDPDAANNQASESTTVTPGAILSGG